VHSAAAERIWHLQRRQVGLVGKPSLALDNRRRLVIEEFDLPAAIGRLAGRVRDDRHIVKVELLGRAELPFGQHAVIGRILAVFRPDLIGGEHHRDRHQRQAVHRPPLDHRQHALSTVHRNLLPTSLSAAGTAFALEVRPKANLAEHAPGGRISHAIRWEQARAGCRPTEISMGPQAGD